MSRFNIKKIAKSIIITSIYLLIWGVFTIYNNYTIDYKEIETTYAESLGIQDLIVRDRVVICFLKKENFNDKNI
jgi:hypothetical protein